MAFNIACLNKLRALLVSLPEHSTPLPSAAGMQMPSSNALPCKAKDEAHTRMQPPSSSTLDVEEAAKELTPHLPLDLSSPSTVG